MFRTRDENNKEDRRTSTPAASVASAFSYSWGDSLILEPVLDDPRRQLISAAPPGSPAIGDRYLVPPDATGAWTGLANQIAEWNGSAWTFAYPYQEILALYGVTLGVGGDKGVLIYSRARGEYLEYAKIEQEDLGTTIWKQRSDVGATPSNYMAWLPLHTADQPHSIVKDRIDSVDVLPASWGTPYPYQKRVIPATSPSPWNVHIGEIAMYVGISSVGGGAWIMQVPAEGDIVWVADKNQFYHYTAAGAWAPIGNNITLDNLSDVNTSGAIATDVLGYNGTTWVPQTATAPGAHNLDSHSDVTLTAPATGEVLRKSAGDWVNARVQFDDLGDVVLTAPSAGQTITYDGANWVNSAGPAAAPHDVISASHGDTTTTGSLATGDVLYRSGSNWTNRPNTLANLGGVTLTSPDNGQILMYNGTVWINSSVASTINLDDLSNVDTTGKSNNSIIWWNSSSGKWEDRLLVLDDLSDVSTSGAVAGQAMIYNGSAWVPGTPTASVTAAYLNGWLTGVSFVTNAAVSVSYSAPGGIHTFTCAVAGHYACMVSCDVACRIDIAGTPYTPTLSFTNQLALYRSAGGAFQVRFPSTGESANATITVMRLGG